MDTKIEECQTSPDTSSSAKQQRQKKQPKIVNEDIFEISKSSEKEGFGLSYGKYVAKNNL